MTYNAFGGTLNLAQSTIMTKSSDCKFDLVKGHASRPFISTAKHLFLIAE